MQQGKRILYSDYNNLYISIRKPKKIAGFDYPIFTSYYKDPQTKVLHSFPSHMSYLPQLPNSDKKLQNKKITM